MSFNSSGVNLKGQFNLKTTDPIDGRYVITTKEEYEEFTKKADGKALYLYPGLIFTITTELTLKDGTKKVPGAYQVAADGQTVNKVPKFTIADTIPNDSTPGVLGDIIVVVNTGN